MIAESVFTVTIMLLILFNSWKGLNVEELWVIFFVYCATETLYKYYILKEKKIDYWSSVCDGICMCSVIFYYSYCNWCLNMDEKLGFSIRLKVARTEKRLSQNDLAEIVGVSRQTISSIETNQYCPSAKLALLLCIALDKTFEDLFYFE